MSTVTVFLWLMGQTEFHLVHNQKENCHCDRIAYTLVGFGSQSKGKLSLRSHSIQFGNSKYICLSVGKCDQL